ncbi:MAG TPA: VTC domain-containing protein, partial [Verrucomicrobiota bacterium]|nr:VTC domain-containing protein [Verrucomicrobiota bacterium]
MNPAPAFQLDGACELKFRLAPEQVGPVLAWLRANLAPDPHGGGDDADTYHVHSLYFDTPALNVFHRRGLHGRVKFRIRRYGVALRLFAERKLKRRGRVNKHRTALAEAEMLFFNGTPPPDAWPALWFRRRVHRHALRPVLALSYRHRPAARDVGPRPRGASGGRPRRPRRDARRSRPAPGRGHPRTQVSRGPARALPPPHRAAPAHDGRRLEVPPGRRRPRAGWGSAGRVARPVTRVKTRFPVQRRPNVLPASCRPTGAALR